MEEPPTSSGHSLNYSIHLQSSPANYDGLRTTMACALKQWHFFPFVGLFEVASVFLSTRTSVSTHLVFCIYGQNIDQDRNHKLSRILHSGHLNLLSRNGIVGTSGEQRTWRRALRRTEKMTCEESRQQNLLAPWAGSPCTRSDLQNCCRTLFFTHFSNTQCGIFPRWIRA